MSIGTQTRTYTVVDIRRVLDSFAADLAMIVQATGLRSRENVAKTVYDLKAFSEAGYLVAVTVILFDEGGTELRAAVHSVSTIAVGWDNQRPGNNIWPRTPGGSLAVIATIGSDWWAMDQGTRNQFRQDRGLNWAWEPSSVDTSHRGMTAEAGRRYASNGYGMERVNYR